jgi:hypothetical protein
MLSVRTNWDLYVPPSAAPFLLIVRSLTLSTDSSQQHSKPAGFSSYFLESWTHRLRLQLQEQPFQAYVKFNVFRSHFWLLRFHTRIISALFVFGHFPILLICLGCSCYFSFVSQNLWIFRKCAIALFYKGERSLHSCPWWRNFSMPLETCPLQWNVCWGYISERP